MPSDFILDSNPSPKNGRLLPPLHLYQHFDR
jgi:hypothetical protein